jgi:hypothetical protein
VNATDNNDEALDAAVWKRIREWPLGDWPELLAYVRARWYLADWGWTEENAIDDISARPVRRYLISTAGWSDNEWLMSALEANCLFWVMCWVQSRRGGHYIFEIPEQRKADDNG